MAIQTDCQAGHLFTAIPTELPAELTDTLLQTDNIRIERIVSKGHTSPEQFWYDQEEHEWVLVLKGAAILTFAEGERQVRLAAGDYLHIPAHAKHRVEWTTPGQETVWLAVFYR